MDGWTDRHKDVQRETIIPRHYIVGVGGYKNHINFLAAEFALYMLGENFFQYFLKI